MEYDKLLGEINSISNLTIHLSLPWSTISCYHIVKYVDLINKTSDIASFKGGRISTLTLSTENVVKVLKNITKSLDKTECEEIKITIYGDNLQFYVKEIERTLELRSSIDNDYNISTAVGNDFLLKNIPDEIFEYKNKKLIRFLNYDSFIFPYLLVIINYKITFLKITSCNTSEKVYETSLNCDFLLTVANCLLGVKTLEEVFQFINKSESYNDSDKKRFIAKDGVPCNTGNVFDDKGDLACYLLQTFLHNLCDLINLQSIINNVYKVIVGEYFNNTVFLDILNECFERHSNSNVRLYFMRHNGISTAIGTLLKEISSLDRNISWLENYSISSGLINEDNTEERNIKSYLALDSLNATLISFPLLKDPKNYNPHFQDFTNTKIREYWLNCVGEAVNLGMKSKIETDPKGKCNSVYIDYSKLFTEKVALLKKHPCAYGSFSFVLIQDILHQLKKELGLYNSFYLIKTKETNAALQILKKWFKYFDGLQIKERHVEIAKSLLAGNMFDWGAKEIHKLFSSNTLDFKTALNTVPARPWTVDKLDLWLKRMNESPHKFAAIFPDNCGFDFILGIIPFTRELIKRGTEVVFCVNKEPVLNDITSYEMKHILEEICLICPIINSAYKTNKILVIEHARCSPCLDLRYVNKEFARLCHHIDLLVIDGMGRSIHTNFNANFLIECLRVAVVKDKYLSKEIGGKEFAAVFNYTRA